MKLREPHEIDQEHVGNTSSLSSLKKKTYENGTQPTSTYNISSFLLDISIASQCPKGFSENLLGDLRASH
jgi:hypothetical protein